MNQSNLFLIFILVVFNIFFYKYFSSIVKRYSTKVLIDSQLNKPQAFHILPTSIIGGLGIYFSLLIIHFYYFQFGNTLFMEYLSFCTLFFFLGFADDLKINFNPRMRLAIMITFLVILIKYNNFYLGQTGIEYLDFWIAKSEIFSLIFILLCFLFVVNGSNLIDGYNGLLGIHSLIILINLFIINFLYDNKDLYSYLFLGILIITIFLVFNFPKAKTFLGDGGSYLLGTFLAISVIKTSIAIPQISPFYFCILLFYLFFEVFFLFLES